MPLHFLPPAATRALALASLVSVACLTGCPAFDVTPCFPGSSAAPVDESEGGFSRKTLGWEIDKMAALVDVPDSDEPPSEVYLHAQRDMRTEFWADAAKELLAIVRGDTKDGKRLRLYAQYDLALALFRMRYFDEAKRIFVLIAQDKKHPRQREAKDWTERKACPS